MKKVPLSYEECSTPDGVPFLMVHARQGRIPLVKVRVAQAGYIEFQGADGLIETIGDAENPCSVAVLTRIRTHHDGLLMVLFDSAKPADVTEVVLSARLA